MTRLKSLQHILELNFAVLCISTSGALARYIDLPVIAIIASRALLGGFLIYLFCKWNRFDLTIKKSDRLIILVGGLLMCGHWLSYFYALKLSNVAIGMISLFTFPVITALLEPLILKTRFQKIHLLLGIMVIVGIYFLVPKFDIANNNTRALGFGVFSAICFSLRNIIMKSKVSTYNGSVLMLYQMVVVAICLSPFFIISSTEGIITQLPSLLILALVTTAIGHTLFLYGFRHFSATSVSIISSTQPIYGIIIGMLFLKEYPAASAVLGGAIILASAMLESLRNYK
jgi:drug/metabolite transporter (DMT)-like permease